MTQSGETGSARAMESMTSLPNDTSPGDGKYVGDVCPQLPSTDATCHVMPIRSPARIRAAFTSTQSPRGLRWW